MGCSSCCPLNALELIPNAQTIFPALVPGPTILSTRVAEGYNFIAGNAFLSTPVAPGGTIRIQQSMDGLNWTQVDDFPLPAVPPFTTTWNVVIVGRYVQTIFINLTAVPLTIMIQGLLKAG